MRVSKWTEVLVFAATGEIQASLAQLEVAEKMYRRRKFDGGNELNPSCVSEADISNFKRAWKRNNTVKFPRVALP